MGPEGGASDGTVFATGTPEDVATNPDSYAGHFLTEALDVPRSTQKGRKRSKARPSTGWPVSRNSGWWGPILDASCGDIGMLRRDPCHIGNRGQPSKESS